MTTGEGTFRGAHRPNQTEFSKLGTPASSIVGTSGSKEERFLLVTASACTAPALICPYALTKLSNMMGVRPEMTSIYAGDEPRYGTCVKLMPASNLNISPERCWPVPTPPEAKLIWPGLFLAKSTSSLTECAGRFLLTTSTKEKSASIPTGVKSPIGS